MAVDNSKNHLFRRALFTYIVLCIISTISSHAVANTLTTPFESSDLTSSSYFDSPDNNDLFASDANDYVPFSSPQNELLFAGFGDDDDFGDEEIGIIPVGNGIGYLIILSLGYILVSSRKNKVNVHQRTCITEV